jgi:hypothetical protein
MDIAGEMLMDGFSVFVASITAWNDSQGELINESERARIVSNVKSYLEARGQRVYLS